MLLLRRVNTRQANSIFTICFMLVALLIGLDGLDLSVHWRIGIEVSLLVALVILRFSLRDPILAAHLGVDAIVRESRKPEIILVAKPGSEREKELESR